MSHFAVLVIGPDVEKQLAPYHEFECTGNNDQYVQDVDRTAEAREQFAKETEQMLRGPDGALHSFFDDAGNWRPEFSKLVEQDPSHPLSRFRSREREKFVPEGYTEVEVPTSQVQPFAKWASDYYGAPVVLDGQQPNIEAEHKFGYTLVDKDGEVIKLVDRTNPNKKWDWYSIGGRWSGWLKLKPGASGLTGEEGVMGSHFARGEDRADVANAGDVDWTGMRAEAMERAGSEWDAAFALHQGEPWTPWAKVRDEQHKGNLDAAREAYHAQPAVARMQADKEFMRDHFMSGLDDYLLTRAEYVERARRRATSLYAVVHKGEWTARGEMGWFGVSHAECDQDEWDRLCADLIDNLPADTQVTVVDCHI